MAASTTTCGYFQLRRSPAFAPNASRKIGVATAMSRKGGLSLKVSALADDRVGFNENPNGILSGEWTENFSLLCYDDLRTYFMPQSLKSQVSHGVEPSDEINPEAIVSGEWPASSSLMCYDDLRAYFAPQSLKSEVTAPVELLDEISPEAIVSGEWPESFSLLCFEDLKAYFKPQILERQAKRKSVLREVMSLARAASVDQTLEEIEHHFEVVSGLPVIDDEFRCLGFVTKEDKDRATHGLKSKVGEVVSCPPVGLSADKTVLDAAAVMLKMHVQNVAILEEQELIGVVNDSDILHELEVVSA